jgi:L-fuconate dehydratase
VRRCKIARQVIGDDLGLAVGANQRWDVASAIDWLKQLSSFNLAWVEEPTSPDDILGHATRRVVL